MLNSVEYLADPAKRDDNRWVHRSRFDWHKAEKRRNADTVEHRIFNALKKMIAVRKETVAFADFDNRQLFTVDNPNLLVYSRTDTQNARNKVLVVANFNLEAQTLKVEQFRPFGLLLKTGMKDLYTGSRINVENDAINIPALSFYWLTD